MTTASTLAASFMTPALTSLLAGAIIPIDALVRLLGSAGAMGGAPEKTVEPRAVGFLCS